jgi:cell division protein ZapA (FtsZ GTPase activity inhibitor)
METLVTFGLGAVTVLIILGIVVVFKLVKQVRELKSFAQILETWVERNDELVNRRIDGEINRVNKMDTDLYSFIDSRLDKLENKLSKQ